MATKKTKTKKTTKAEVPAPVVEERKLPEVQPGEHTFIMSTNEVFSTVQILGFARDVFKQMSMNCAVEGDKKAEEVYAARSELSGILFEKFRITASIGEPTSRAFH